MCVVQQGESKEVCVQHKLNLIKINILTRKLAVVFKRLASYSLITVLDFVTHIVISNYLKYLILYFMVECKNGV